MNAVLIATNLDGYNTKALKQIAQAALGLDLSSKKKDKFEALRLLARMFNGLDEERCLKSANPILGHFYLTFVVSAEKEETKHVINLFDGFKLTLIEAKQNCCWIISGALDQWLNFLEWDNEISDLIYAILERENLLAH